MRKTVYLLAGLFLTGCGGDSLSNIQNQKIKGSELTWESALKQFSYCTENTKKWELKEDTEQRAVALFSCDVKTPALSLFNDRLAEKALTYKKSDAENLKLPLLVSADFTIKIIHNKTGKAKKYNEFSITEKVIGKYDDNSEHPNIGRWVKDNTNPASDFELPSKWFFN